ncbi:MAG: zinc-dependent metalloprotease [Mycobacteriales bacterium]
MTERTGRPGATAYAPPLGAGDDAPPLRMVDWDLAVRTAEKLIPGGPAVSRSEAVAAVEALRRLADVADGHVRELTGLDPAGRSAPVRIVDRSDWIATNAAGLSAVLDPLVQHIAGRRGKMPGRVAQVVGPRITGTETGAVLAFLSGKVLGQYDVFGPRGGELLLVAPNVVHVERLLAVDPSDFRLWVCLHECTHRLQFTAVPWLADHLLSEVMALGESIEVDPKVLSSRVKEAMSELAGAARGHRSGPGDGLLSLIQGPEAAAVMDRITALMSVVEGHAEYVMDAVGPDVVPSVKAIRRKFSKRRRGGSALDRFARRMLGLDAKMRQYAEGSAFVRGVVERAGMDGFNAVWTSAETLPRKSELADPGAWVSRVHG